MVYVSHIFKSHTAKLFSYLDHTMTLKEIFDFVLRSTVKAFIFQYFKHNKVQFNKIIRLLYNCNVD